MELVKVRIVRGSIAYDPPDSAPTTGAGTVHEAGDVVELPQRLVDRYCKGKGGICVELAGKRKKKAPSKDAVYEAEVKEVLHSRSRSELDKIAKRRGVSDPEQMSTKQKVAEAIVNSRRG